MKGVSGGSPPTWLYLRHSYSIAPLFHYYCHHFRPYHGFPYRYPPLPHHSLHTVLLLR